MNDKCRDCGRTLPVSMLVEFPRIGSVCPDCDDSLRGIERESIEDEPVRFVKEKHDVAIVGC